MIPNDATIVEPVATPLPAPTPNTGYPRVFTYTILRDNRHEPEQRMIQEPVTLDNFQQLLGKRYRVSTAQQPQIAAGKLTREEALAQWIEEHSKHVDPRWVQEGV